MAPEPVFIVGCPRSGTGLLRDLLRAHPAIAIPHESHFIPALYRGWGDPRDAREAHHIAAMVAQRMGWDSACNQRAVDAARSCGAVVDLVYSAWAQRQGKRRWGDKTPDYLLELPLLRELFPSCKIVHIMRDGRDVTLSLLRSHIGPENVPTAAAYWKRRVETGRTTGHAMGPERYHELRYEELLQQPEPVLRAVCDFLGEPFHRSVLKPDFLEKPVRPLIIGARDHSVVSKTEIVTSNRGKWRRSMSQRDQRRFESVAGTLLRDLGYETTPTHTGLPSSRSPGPRAARALRAIAAAAHHHCLYLAYRLNTGKKGNWLRLTLWMWRARTRHLLRRAGLVGPPVRVDDTPSEPPTAPGATPLIGHGPALLRDKLGFLTRCAREDDVVRLRLGGNALLLNDPRDIEHVLIGNHRNYGKSERLTSARGKRLAGSGLLTSAPPDHGPKRRLLRPAFHRETLVALTDLIVSNTGEMLDDWSDGAVVDIEHATARLARRNIVGSLFSADTRGDASFLDQAIVDRQRYIEYVFTSLLPLRELWPLPVTLRYRRAMRLIDEFIYEQIAARRAGDDHADLLSMLVDARFEDGSHMTDEQVRDEAVVMSLTGYETIGEALTWTLYLLSQHPEVRDRLREQLVDVVGDRAPEAADLESLPLLRAVLAESLRLYPPTWIQVRIAIGDDRLPGGAAVPAGTKLYLCQWVTHRTERYFRDAGAFVPQRFLDANPAYPKNAYFPFGLGPRRCLGENLAWLEASLVLAMVLPRFDLAPAEDRAIEPDPGLILRPRGGLPMRCAGLATRSRPSLVPARADSLTPIPAAPRIHASNHEQGLPTHQS